MYLETETRHGQRMSFLSAAEQLIAKANDHISQSGALVAAHDGNPDTKTTAVIAALDRVAHLERELGYALREAANRLAEKEGLKQ